MEGYNLFEACSFVFTLLILYLFTYQIGLIFTFAINKKKNINIDPFKGQGNQILIARYLIIKKKRICMVRLAGVQPDPPKKAFTLLTESGKDRRPKGRPCPALRGMTMPEVHARENGGGGGAVSDSQFRLRRRGRRDGDMAPVSVASSSESVDMGRRGDERGT